MANSVFLKMISICFLICVYIVCQLFQLVYYLYFLLLCCILTVVMTNELIYKFLRMILSVFMVKISHYFHFSILKSFSNLKIVKR